MPNAILLAETQLNRMILDLESMLDQLTLEIAYEIASTSRKIHTVVVGQWCPPKRCDDCGANDWIYEDKTIKHRRCIVDKCKECKTEYVSIPLKNSEVGNLLRDLKSLCVRMERLNESNQSDLDELKVVPDNDFQERLFSSQLRQGHKISLKHGHLRQLEIPLELYSMSDTSAESSIQEN